jgi:hypothetical protein
MPFTKVSVDTLYKKVGSPKQQQKRRFMEITDEIFADLLTKQETSEKQQKPTPGDAQSVSPVS